MDSFENKKIKVGIVGSGLSGIRHAAMINICPESNLEAVCDPSQELHGCLALLGFKTEIYSDPDLLYRELDLDAVLICTDPETHLSIAEKAVTYPLSIYLDNPLTLSWPEARRFTSLLRERPFISGLGYPYPFRPLFQEGKRLIDIRIVGITKRIRASLHGSLPLNPATTRNLGGESSEPIARWGTGIFFLLHWLFGPVSSVFAKISQDASGRRHAAAVLMECLTDVPVFVDISFHRPGYRHPHTQLIVEGTQGQLELNDDHIKIHLYKPNLGYEKGWTIIDRTDRPSKEWFFLGEEGLFQCVHSFLRSCAEQKPPPVTWNEGVEVMRILEAVKLSAAQNTTISIEEVS